MGAFGLGTRGGKVIDLDSLFQSVGKITDPCLVFDLSIVSGELVYAINCRQSEMRLQGRNSASPMGAVSFLMDITRVSRSAVPVFRLAILE